MESTNSVEPVLCSLCNRFYGNPATCGLCSFCHKNQLSTIVQPPSHSDSGVPPEQAPREPTALHPKVEIDTTRCYGCKRKLGMLGFKCRCELMFCKLHRMPQQHDCEFDYAKQGKTLLQKENPLVKAKKIGQI